MKPRIRHFRDIYNTYYKPIRHKIFAHADKQYHSRIDELWQATKNANMEDMLNFLEDLNLSIREAYLNGRKPELMDRKFDEQWFEKDIKLLLERVKNA